MNYVLEKHIKIQKWGSGKSSCTIDGKPRPFPLKPEEYTLLKSCDGLTDLPVSDALVNRIVVNLGVSKEWLEQGTDLPFAKQPNVPAITTVNATQLSTAVQGTPVYDIDVTAGTMPRARMFTDDQIVGSINLPDVMSQNCRVVRVSGDSMSPVIRSGDYIAVRELTNFQQIFWGQIYVVLLDDYRLVKYIRRHENPAMVILRSENRNYDDMEIRRADIRELMFVQHIIHLDTRN